jgi:hypothetical protein
MELRALAAALRADDHDDARGDGWSFELADGWTAHAAPDGGLR